MSRSGTGEKAVLLSWTSSRLDQIPAKHRLGDIPQLGTPPYSHPEGDPPSAGRVQRKVRRLIRSSSKSSKGISTPLAMTRLTWYPGVEGEVEAALTGGVLNLEGSKAVHPANPVANRADFHLGSQEG